VSEEEVRDAILAATNSCACQVYDVSVVFGAQRYLSLNTRAIYGSDNSLPRNRKCGDKQRRKTALDSASCIFILMPSLT
jgi:hypothetical protein